MSQSVFPAEFGDLITAIIVYLSGLTSIILVLIGRWIKKKELLKTKKGADN